MNIEWLTMTWKVLVLRGVVGVVVGGVAMAWPGETVAAFVILWGLWALLDGVGCLVEAWGTGPGWWRWASLLMGVVSVVVGVLAVSSPAMTATALTWLVGLWLASRGVVNIVLAVDAAAGRSLLLGGGVVDVLLGVLFMANPGRSAVGIAWLLGLVAVVWGLAFLAVGLVVRAQQARADGPAVTGRASTGGRAAPRHPSAQD